MVVARAQMNRERPLPIPKHPGAHPKQKCVTCPHQKKCYSTKTSHNKTVNHLNVAINIYICRIKMGIDVNNSTKNLLNLLRPGIIKLVTSARRQSGGDHIDFDEILMDAQSKAIEFLTYDYQIGDFLVATAYLFNPISGFLTRWAQTAMAQTRKFNSHHRLFGDIPTDSQESDESDSEEDNYIDRRSPDEYMTAFGQMVTSPESADKSMLHEAMSVIEDGVTLNANEYRVLRFCLANANEANASRHVDGLHLQLAVLMGVSRPRITRLYKRAKDKLTEAYARRQNEHTKEGHLPQMRVQIPESLRDMPDRKEEVSTMRGMQGLVAEPQGNLQPTRKEELARFVTDEFGISRIRHPERTVPSGEIGANTRPAKIIRFRPRRRPGMA